MASGHQIDHHAIDAVDEPAADKEYNCCHEQFRTEGYEKLREGRDKGVHRQVTQVGQVFHDMVVVIIISEANLYIFTE